MHEINSVYTWKMYAEQESNPQNNYIQRLGNAQKGI